MIEVSLAEALDVLRRGQILIYPTETFYGLGVDIRNAEALSALFRFKGREAVKAVSVLVSGLKQLKALVSELSPNTLNIINKYLPGPLTLVLPAALAVPAALQSEGAFVGIRWSSHPLAQRLVETYGVPITTTSANPSGEPSARDPETLRRYFGSRDDVFLLSGAGLPPSQGSTVVKVHQDRLELLRAGDIAFAEIEHAFGAKDS